jgi:uncharacterized membrane protein YfcA
MNTVQAGLAAFCGLLVGFTLGLIGGGGSIMATPLLLYVVGLPPHMAIGTGALAVSVNALANFAGHARARNVRWRSAILFAVIGAASAALGSLLGKTFDGQRLLFLFAILMIVVGVLMLRRGRQSRSRKSDDLHAQTRRSRPFLVTFVALIVGMLSGFFGIGGGFLIVPGLLVSTGMPIIYAVGSSLLAVGSFGLTTAISYAWSGLVDWLVAVEYIVGGLFGGWLGMMLAVKLATKKALLSQVFAGFVFIVATYMLYRNLGALSVL